MKKITKVLALALAFMMAFALQAPVNAAEKATVQAVNQNQAQAAVQVGGVYASVDYLSDSYVGIKVNNSAGAYLEFCLCDNKGKVIQTKYANPYTSYVLYSVKKNRLYFYKFRAVQYDYSQGKYIPYSGWFKSALFTTAKYKVSKVGNSRKVKIKTPKVAGIKNYKIYMSLKKNKGWKKVKTVKAGKAVVVSKFKGKAFKLNKNYYYKIVPNKGQAYISGFYFYRILR